MVYNNPAANTNLKQESLRFNQWQGSKIVVRLPDQGIIHQLSSSQKKLIYPQNRVRLLPVVSTNSLSAQEPANSETMELAAFFFYPSCSFN